MQLLRVIVNNCIKRTWREGSSALRLSLPPQPPSASDRQPEQRHQHLAQIHEPEHEVSGDEAVVLEVVVMRLVVSHEALHSLIITVFPPWRFHLRELASSSGIKTDTRTQAHTALKTVPKAGLNA